MRQGIHVRQPFLVVNVKNLFLVAYTVPEPTQLF